MKVCVVEGEGARLNLPFFDYALSNNYHSTEEIMRLQERGQGRAVHNGDNSGNSEDGDDTRQDIANVM